MRSTERLSQLEKDLLVQRARQGDRRSLEALFGLLAEAMTIWARHDLRPTAAAHEQRLDLLQDTRERAYKKFASFQGQSFGEFSAWMRQILKRNAILTMRRAGRHKRKPQLLLPIDSLASHELRAPDPTPSQNVARSQEFNRAVVFLSGLPSEQQQAIISCILEDHPVPVVARTMSRSASSVAGLLRRGLEALHRTMTSSPVPPDDPGCPGEPGDHDGLSQALLTFLQSPQGGRQLDAEAFLKEHPSCARRLRPMLLWISLLRAVNHPE